MVFDTVTQQPACVILQAIYGGDSTYVHLYNDWVLSPNPNLKMMEATIEQLQKHAVKMNKKSL
jgi:hypothetical protein